MSKNLFRSLLTDIRIASLYALIADETRDISDKEQLAIFLRWVDKSYTVYEDIVDLVQVETTNASTIRSVLKDCLIRCTIPLSNCPSQAYDGAANMAGHLQGFKSSFYSLCAAQSLNLCLQECGRLAVKVGRDALGLVNEVCNFIRICLPSVYHCLNAYKLNYLVLYLH